MKVLFVIKQNTDFFIRYEAKMPNRTKTKQKLCFTKQSNKYVLPNKILTFSFVKLTHSTQGQVFKGPKIRRCCWKRPTTWQKQAYKWRRNFRKFWAPINWWTWREFALRLKKAILLKRSSNIASQNATQNKNQTKIMFYQTK